MIRITISNFYGKKLAEIQPNIEFVSWILNQPGETRFFLPFTDIHCTPNNMKYGNKILIEFDNGLPNFTGVLDEPRRITSDGVNMMGFTEERIFSWRETEKIVEFEAKSAGEIYKELILAANADYDTGLTMGSIFIGTVPREQMYYNQNLTSVFDHLALEANEDFAVIDSIAYWYEKRGTDKRHKVGLVEGGNASSIVKDEQGIIGNRIRIYGDGLDWSSSRLEGTAENAGSRNKYSLRSYSQVLSDIVNHQITLDATAEAYLAKYKEPREIITLITTNQPPAVFSSYDIGDIVEVQAFITGGNLWGIKDPYRVLSREWHPDDTVRVEVVRHYDD